MRRNALRPLTLIAILGLVAVVVGAQAPTPKDADQLTARVVVQLLERGHMAKPRIDDEIAKNGARTSSKSSIPRRIISRSPTSPSSWVRPPRSMTRSVKGNLDFAGQVFARYLQRKRRAARHREGSALRQGLPRLHQRRNRSSDDPDLYDYPADAKEASERWRKKLKFDLLQLKVVDKVDWAEGVRNAFSSDIATATGIVHQFDMSELLEVYLGALTRTFDPHSSYMNSKTLEDTDRADLAPLAGGHRCIALDRRRLRGGQGDRPRHGRRQGRSAPAEDKIVGIRRGTAARSTSWRRSSTTSSATSGDRAGRRFRLIVQPAGTKETEGLRAHASEDRAHGAARQGPDHRIEGREWQAAQDRRDQPAGVLRRYSGDLEGCKPTP